MKLPRRKFLHLAAGASALPSLSRVAWAQAYPAKPVRIIVGFAAGGAFDITARLIGQWLSERLGQSFIVENRPGANTNIGTEAVVRSPPDGYTLLLAGTTAATNAALYKLNFDFIRDIAPVAGITRESLVIVVNPSVPAKTVPEFIAYAKTNPGKVNMGSSGNGSALHVSGELFKMMTGIHMVHVPYRGGAPALTDLMGGQVQVMFATMPSALEYVRAGKLRALAVTTTTRSEVLPDLPTVGELVPGYEASTWYGERRRGNVRFGSLGDMSGLSDPLCAQERTSVIPWFRAKCTEFNRAISQFCVMSSRNHVFASRVSPLREEATGETPWAFIIVIMQMQRNLGLGASLDLRHTTKFRSSSG